MLSYSSAGSNKSPSCTLHSTAFRPDSEVLRRHGKMRGSNMQTVTYKACDCFTAAAAAVLFFIRMDFTVSVGYCRAAGGAPWRLPGCCWLLCGTDCAWRRSRYVPPSSSSDGILDWEEEKIYEKKSKARSNDDDDDDNYDGTLAIKRKNDEALVKLEKDPWMVPNRTNMLPRYGYGFMVPFRCASVCEFGNYYSLLISIGVFESQFCLASFRTVSGNNVTLS